MDSSEQARLDALYAQHLRALKLQGKATATIDSYTRAIRRVSAHFDRCPDRLDGEDFKTYFAALIDTRSWSLVKIERCGLQFFYQHVLGRDWPWVERLKPPKVQSLPDVLTVEEIARIIRATLERRYQTFWLIAYSMGLRLGETLSLRIGDIDAGVSIPVGLPAKWVVDCRNVGRGKPALQYLSRYLYRGVIRERDLLAYDANAGTVTFGYQDAQTGHAATRTLSMADFLWRVLLYVLPTGFRRVRDYGFLHGNAKRRLTLVQLLLRVLIGNPLPRTRPVVCCPVCHTPMVIIRITPRLRPDS